MCYPGGSCGPSEEIFKLRAKYLEEQKNKEQENQDSKTTDK